MLILKIIPFVDYNLLLKHLDTQLNEPTNQIQLKSPMFFKQTNKKTLYKTLGTRVINSPMSTHFLLMITCCYLKKNVDFVSPPSILFRHLCNFSLIYVPQSNLSVPENLSIFCPLTLYHYWLNFILQNEYFHNILLRKPYPPPAYKIINLGHLKQLIFSVLRIQNFHTPLFKKGGDNGLFIAQVPKVL